MSDIYREQLIAKEKGTNDTVKEIAILVISAIILAITGIIELKAVIVVFAIIAWIDYILFKRMNVEYEYIYTNGILDIDCIYNKEKRKNVFTGNVAKFEIMAHINDEEHLKDFKKLPIKNFSSGRVYGNTYVFIANVKRKRYKVIFEPDSELVNIMNIDLTPRRLFKNK